MEQATKTLALKNHKGEIKLAYGDARVGSHGLGSNWVKKCAYTIAGIAFITTAAFLETSTPVLAQEATQPKLAVPPILFLRLGKQNNIPLIVGPTASVATDNFVVISGLPPNLTVPKGFIVAPGVWSIPAASLDGLAFTLTDGKLGRWAVVIKLVTIDNDVIAEAKTTIVIVPQGEPEPKRDIDSAPSSSAATAQQKKPRPITPADRTHAVELYNSGIEQLKNGNIYAARKFFERSAQLGLGEAALAMGDTFEPSTLIRLNVVGLQPDLNSALEWYERARDLGAVGAEEKLKKGAK